MQWQLQLIQYHQCLSFQVVFTGCESDFDDSQNIHGGAISKNANHSTCC